MLHTTHPDLNKHLGQKDSFHVDKQLLQFGKQACDNHHLQLNGFVECSFLLQAGWTEGKLYCPKCNARVGGFDFLHVVQCSCDNDVIPAIWCPKSKVDHVKKLENKYDMKRVMHGEKLKEGQENVTISDSSNQAFGGKRYFPHWVYSSQ